jgi:sphingomyelin phosphodiesterase acid-like 3
MISMIKAGAIQALFMAGLLFFCGGMPGRIAIAQESVMQQKKSVDAGARTIPALMLSDFHFDPFHDPGKVLRLVDAPVSEWDAILGEPASQDQEQALAALQRTCGARGLDTSYALLQSSLEAVRAQASGARFVMVSGDLIAHNFACRFSNLVPGKTPSDYAAFVEKTMDYVMGELHRAVPGVPVYATLGNNDSGCGDYQMDPNSAFLAAAGKIMLQGLPSEADKRRAVASFAEGGFYSVTMAAPMRRTRLIVLNDLFMSRSYETCGGKRDLTEAAREMAWLGKELDAARRQGQRVWVLGHIPPGVDVYATVRKMKDVCGGAGPTMFLASEELAETLVAHADVVRLGIFAHTHMDELRLVGPESGKAAAKEMVAVKMVAAISPVNGNRPSFTLAKVDPAGATLVDYAVVVASNSTGVGTSWAREYDYSEAYGEAAFSPAALVRLLGEFKDDPEAKTEKSQAFIRSFVAGDGSSLIKPLWPEYVCALSRVTSKGFEDCACSAR